jgi:uncharacterized membrane protein YhhN
LFSVSDSLTRAVFTLLAVAMLVTVSRLKGRFHRRVLYAFIALVVGNVLLLTAKQNDGSVLAFLCFVVAQIYLTRAFYLDFSSAPELDKFGARIAIAGGIIFSFATYLFLRPHLGNYRIPGLIYTFITTMVVMMASFRRLRVNKLSFNLILGATMLSACTGVLFAVQYFIMKSSTDDVLVDLFYMLSVYLITIGTIERKLVTFE